MDCLPQPNFFAPKGKNDGGVSPASSYRYHLIIELAIDLWLTILPSSIERYNQRLTVRPTRRSLLSAEKISVSTCPACLPRDIYRVGSSPFRIGRIEGTQSKTVRD